MSRAAALTVAAVLLGAGLAGCSEQPALCDAVDELQASVDNVRDVNISENGLGEIQDRLSAVGSDLRQVRTEAEAEYSAQVDAVEADLTEVTSSAEAAQQGPSAATLSAVGDAVAVLVDDVTALADDVSTTC